MSPHEQGPVTATAGATGVDPGGTALVFPGMGPVPFTDVAKFMVVHPVARRLVAAADEVLGYPLVQRYRESSSDYSEAAQVAFLVNCLALAEWSVETLGIDPAVVVGPSFGQRAAAVHSGALSFADGVRLTARLARLLDDYFATEHREVVTRSFVRVPGEQLDSILVGLTADGIWHEVSCYLDDDFFMVSLPQSQVDRLDREVRGAGGLPLYTMRPPMHCAAFAGLRERAGREVLSTLRFADPRMPLIEDHDGAPVATAEQVRGMLLDHIVRPLHWPRVVAALRAVA